MIKRETLKKCKQLLKDKHLNSTELAIAIAGQPNTPLYFQVIHQINDLKREGKI